jgi:hypothetical protein
MKGTVMPPQRSNPRRDDAANSSPQGGRETAQALSRPDLGHRALRLLGLLAIGMTLAACDRCGDFLPSSQSQIGACHSDPPRQ